MPQKFTPRFMRNVAGFAAVAAVGLSLAGTAGTASAQDRMSEPSSAIPAPPSLDRAPADVPSVAPGDMPATPPANSMPDLRSAVPSVDSTQTAAVPKPVDVASAVNSDSLIGAKVRNSSNEVVGKIDSLLLTPDARVAGVVVGVGGFLGIGVHEVVVPMEQISMIDDDNVSLPSATKEELRAEPAYRKPTSN